MKELIKKVTENKLFKKLVNRETILYLVFGVLTTAVNFAAFKAFDILFMKLEFLGTYSYLAANAVAWLISVIFAFITNKLFVFDSKSWAFKLAGYEFLTFTGARVFSLLVEQGLLALFVERIGMKKMLAKLIIAVIVVILNYVFSKLIIFKKKDNSTNEK